MALTFDDYIAILKTGVYQPFARLSFLRPVDESVYFEYTSEILDGSLTIQKENGVRRTINLTLKNENGQFTPHKDGLWVNSKFFVELGIKDTNGELFLFPQGVFVLRNPSMVSLSNSNTITIDGIDKFALLNGTLGGTLDGTYQVPILTDVHTAIRNILSTNIDAALTVKIDPKAPLLSSINLVPVNPYTIIKEVGANLGDILLELGGLSSVNSFYDANGYYNFRQDVSDLEKPISFYFSTNEFYYQGSTYNLAFEDLRNKVIVIGDNVNGAIYDASATMTDSLSPFNIYRIGVKTEVINDSNIYSDALAELRAAYELKRLLSIQSSVDLQCIPMYHLDVDTLIALTDDKLGLVDEKFLIRSITLPFQPNSNMSISAVKASELSFTVTTI